MAVKKSKAENDFGDQKPHEQPLQAVLLAYDWTGGYAANPNDQWQFRPLELDRPKVLCPLVNQPIIDYSIKYLASQGASEIYVVCVTETVEEYVKTSTSLMKNGATIFVVRDPSVSNEGDALRELDKRNVVKSDPFILLRGDSIVNCELSLVMNQHRARHKADSSAIYTMILKSRPHVQSLAHDLLVGIDPKQSNRILLYDNNDEHKSVAFPCSLFTNHCSSLAIRHDLADTGLDLCSPDVLARFSDEFDYRDIRTQFITNSVAEEEEGLQTKIFAHITDQYAAKCTDFRSYHQIARDLMRRQVHPIAPDNIRAYHMQRHFLYEEISGKTRIGRSSKIDGPGMIGMNCFIGEDCIIRGSVVCEYSHISDKSTIINSHLLEGVQIEAGASVYDSILAAGVVVLHGATVSKGCVIGAGCIVGANVTLPEYTRLTCVTERLDNDDANDDDWDDDYDNEDEEDSSTDQDKVDATNVAGPASDSLPTRDTDLVGPDGLGRRWKPSLTDDLEDNEYDDEEPVIFPAIMILQAQCLGFDETTIQAQRTAYHLESPDDGLSDMDDESESMLLDDEDDDDGMDGGVTFGGATAAAAPIIIIGRQEGVDVVQDLKGICLEFDASAGSPVENLAIELNSYKFSQNATYSDCTMAAMLAIIERLNITATVGDGKLVSDFKNLLVVWKPLLIKMGIGLAEEVAMVNALQRVAFHDPNDDIRKKLSSGMTFRLLLQTLHEQDIVSDEAILSWAAMSGGGGGGEGQALVQMPPIQDFLEWLEEDDEEDDDEEEDD